MNGIDNNVTGISPITGLTGTISGSSNNEEEKSGVSFSDMLSNLIGEADDAYATASSDTQALLSGEVDDLAQVMINGSKAELSLNLVVQVRNKIVDAYNQIMNMQV